MGSLSDALSNRAAGLLLTAVLAALPTARAVSQTHNDIRLAPTDCQKLVEGFSAELRETHRRLKQVHDRPDADRLRSAILAKALSDPTMARAPEAAADLSELLACLAQP